MKDMKIMKGDGGGVCYALYSLLLSPEPSGKA